MRREVLVPVVHRLELAAIDHDQRLTEEANLAAQLHELGAYLADRSTVIPAEVGDRLEVRRETPREPDQLHVALRFTLEAPARLDAVQVAVDIDLEQRSRMVGRPPRVRWIGALKSERYKVEFINEGIDGTHRIVFGDPVIQSLREEHRLLSTLAFDESLQHAFPRKPRRSYYPSIALRFHTAS